MVYCISENFTNLKQRKFSTQVLTERLVCKFVYSKGSVTHYPKDFMFPKYFAVDWLCLTTFYLIQLLKLVIGVQW